jgi:uncharacterized protein with PIN domain
MKFIADTMLGSLAKRLRLLGYDVLYDPALTDNEILRFGLEQGRVILTRDTGLSSRPLAHDHILIKSDLVDEQVHQVLDTFPMPAGTPLTRCSVCNSVLSPLDKVDARDRVSGHVLRTIKVFYECMGCNRVYWEGSHVKNMAGVKANDKPAH